MSNFETRLKLAQEIVTQRHCWENHQRYQSLPYTHHLQTVANFVTGYAVIEELPMDEVQDLILAGWLHDTVEDTKTKLKEIEELFGLRVAALVGAVTNEPGENRRARHAATYPKIRAEPHAVLLKLCDRLANVQAGGGMLKVYRREQEDFRRALQTPGQYDILWGVLERALSGGGDGNP